MYEDYIAKIEKLLDIQFANGPIVQTCEHIIHALAEGFQQNDKINDIQVETVEELLYHFIYMEDCGNTSEHCKSKLVIINEGKEDQHEDGSKEKKQNEEQIDTGDKLGRLHGIRPPPTLSSEKRFMTNIPASKITISTSEMAAAIWRLLAV